MNIHKQPKGMSGTIFILSLFLLVAPMISATGIVTEVNNLTYEGEEYVVVDYFLTDFTDVIGYQVYGEFNNESLEVLGISTSNQEYIFGLNGL